MKTAYGPNHGHHEHLLRDWSPSVTLDSQVPIDLPITIATTWIQENLSASSLDVRALCLDKITSMLDLAFQNDLSCCSIPDLLSALGEQTIWPEFTSTEPTTQALRRLLHSIETCQYRSLIPPGPSSAILHRLLQRAHGPTTNAFHACALTSCEWSTHQDCEYSQNAGADMTNGEHCPFTLVSLPVGEHSVGVGGTAPSLILAPNLRKRSSKQSGASYGVAPSIYSSAVSRSFSAGSNSSPLGSTVVPTAQSASSGASDGNLKFIGANSTTSRAVVAGAASSPLSYATTQSSDPRYESGNLQGAEMLGRERVSEGRDNGEGPHHASLDAMEDVPPGLACSATFWDTPPPSRHPAHSPNVIDRSTTSGNPFANSLFLGESYRVGQDMVQGRMEAGDEREFERGTSLTGIVEDISEEVTGEEPTREEGDHADITSP